MEPSDPTNPTPTSTQTPAVPPAQPNPAIPGSPFPAAPPVVESEHIRNYMVVAILVLLFCSLPLGAVALYYSNKVKSEEKAGNLEAAKKASKSARLWIILGIVIGLPLTILYIASGAKK
jgi:hypothetical protein